jgi:hypothetical protein
LIALGGVIVGGVKHLPYFQLHREEGLVSNLVPGDDYVKMTALLGTQPDFHETLSSGQLYVYNRPWEYIQLLVDHTGTVISVGIYAKTTEFKATLLGGVIVNGPPIGQQVDGIYAYSEAYGMCNLPVGLSSYYFEGGDMNVSTGISVVVGDTAVTDTNDPMAIGVPCNYMLPPPIDDYSLSGEVISQVEAMKGGNAMIENLVPAVVIVAAPNQPITPDMLNTDYFAELAGK